MGQTSSSTYLKETNMNEQMKNLAVTSIDESYSQNRHCYYEDTCNRHLRYSKTTEKFEECDGHSRRICYFDDQAIVDRVLNNFHRTYGGQWTCTAGQHVVFPKYPRPRNFAHFSIYTGYRGPYRIFIYNDDYFPPPVQQNQQQQNTV